MNEFSLSHAILPTPLRPVEQEPSTRQSPREKIAAREGSAQGEYLPASDDYADMQDESQQRRSARETPGPIAMYLETSQNQDTPDRGQYLNLFA